MLASIQKIENLFPIENADNIEIAQVLGWQVVVRKGEFKPGDLCIFIEIDTLIPNKEWSKFLFKPGHEEDEYYRLRTIKLRGQISQGLVLSLYIDPISCEDWEVDFQTGEVRTENGSYLKTFSIGDDVSNVLEIKKYEKPLPNINPKSGIQIERYFPSFLHKTDEINIQSAPQLLEQLKGKPYYITIKVDGTSATYYKYKGKFGVCSRNLELKDPTKNFSSWLDIALDKIRGFFGLRKSRSKTNPREFSMDIYWKIANRHKIMDWLPEGFAIQGEIAGPNIQKNNLGLENHELFIFNLYNINSRRYIDKCYLLETSKEFCLSDANFVQFATDCVCIGGEFNFTLEQLLEIAKQQKYPNRHRAEGIVVRSLDQTISFKVMNSEYLLKDEE